MSSELKRQLDAFRDENQVTSKGRLSIIVQLSRLIREKEFPLYNDDFITENRGQVAGISGSFLKKILADHGITQVLSSEGGRTSRGSIAFAEKCIAFFNELSSQQIVNFEEIEAYWICEVNKFFHSKPFLLSSDESQTITLRINSLFEQAKRRQQENQGTQYMGTVLQHLVAAKLCLVLGQDNFEYHGASVADSPTGRSGDFVLGKTILHCTVKPSEALIDKCKQNIESGCYPIIITVFEHVNGTQYLLELKGLQGRVDVWDIQQFLSANVQEHSMFDVDRKQATLGTLVANYNRIVDEVETDPSLKIAYGSV